MQLAVIFFTLQRFLLFISWSLENVFYDVETLAMFFLLLFLMQHIHTAVSLQFSSLRKFN